MKLTGLEVRDLRRPVVYVLRDGSGAVLYVGVGVNGAVRPLDPRHHAIGADTMRDEYSLELIWCLSAAEARALERRMIDDLRPIWNRTGAVARTAKTPAETPSERRARLGRERSLLARELRAIDQQIGRVDALVQAAQQRTADARSAIAERINFDMSSSGADFLTVDAVAKYFRIGRGEVIRACRAGSLRAIRAGDVWRILPSWAAEWAHSRPSARPDSEHGVAV